MTAPRGSYKFFLKMKKKPALKEVLDNFGDYNHKQLDELSGPVFPVWIRNHLHTLKNSMTKTNQPTPEYMEQLLDNANNAEAYVSAEVEEIANAMQENHTTKEADTFEVRRYTGGHKWIGDPAKSMIEGNTGDLFQLLGYNEIFWGTQTVKTDHASMRHIVAASDSIGIMTAYDYKAYNSNELKKKLNIEDHTPDPSGKITSADFTHSADRYRGEILNSESSTNIGMNGVPVIGGVTNIAGHAVKISKIGD